MRAFYSALDELHDYHDQEHVICSSAFGTLSLRVHPFLYLNTLLYHLLFIIIVFLSLRSSSIQTRQSSSELIGRTHCQHVDLERSD